MELDLKELSIELIKISAIASQKIMEVYNKSSIQVRDKEDGSPVSEADLISHKIINDRLFSLLRDVPILSEEDSSNDNNDSSLFWLVDPLDGTKEFISKNGEFTVNIALINEGIPILGIVEAPALGVSFLGIKGEGSFRLKKDNKIKINTSPMTKELCRIVVSRSHQSKEDSRLIKEAGRNFKKVKILKAGSSLKLCLVAEGLADIYPRLGPTYQWDIAAGQAVLEYAGGKVRTFSDNKISYSFDHKKKNEEFLALGDDNHNWLRTFIKN